MYNSRVGYFSYFCARPPLRVIGNVNSLGRQGALGGIPHTLFYDRITTFISIVINNNHFVGN